MLRMMLDNQRVGSPVLGLCSNSSCPVACMRLTSCAGRRVSRAISLPSISYDVCYGCVRSAAVGLSERKGGETAALTLSRHGVGMVRLL